jgi:hypothetical protein
MTTRKNGSVVQPQQDLLPLDEAQLRKEVGPAGQIGYFEERNCPDAGKGLPQSPPARQCRPGLRRETFQLA